MNWHMNRPDLLVANVQWAELLVALQETSDEQFSVEGPATSEWWAWIHEAGRSEDVWPLLVGDHEGRSYVLGDPLGLGGAADRVTAVAARIREFVLGYSYEDTTATEQLTVARGEELLRYTLLSNWGDHDEGARLEGEDLGIGGILQSHGFDPDAWLEQGTVLRMNWTMLDPDKNPEAHRRLYFGPLRMRVDDINQAALEDA
jgi:hypothetical protein